MRITKPEEYGMRLMMRLAAHGGQMTAGELARVETLPEPTVGKLLHRLRQGEVVSAVRGRRGGYGLARPPEDLTVADVLTALGQPPVGGNPCAESPSAFGSDEVCEHAGHCGLRPVWSHIGKLVDEELARTTLNDLLETERSVAEHLLQFWPNDRNGNGSGNGNGNSKGAASASPCAAALDEESTAS